MSNSPKSAVQDLNLIDKLLKKKFIRFGMVGSIGFVISEILLFGLHGRLGMQRWQALIISNEMALLSNFTLHELWTYRDVKKSNKSIISKLARFHLSSWSGVLIVISVGILGYKILGLNIYLSQALGSAVAMLWNFYWTNFYIFKGHNPSVLLDPEESVL